MGAVGVRRLPRETRVEHKGDCTILWPARGCGAVAPRRPTTRVPAARKPRRCRGQCASTARPPRARPRGRVPPFQAHATTVGGVEGQLRSPRVSGNAQRCFAARKAQGPKMALGAAANVQLTGFWLALACGCSHSCPVTVARANARSAGHGRTTHSTSFVEVERRPS